MKKFVGFAAAVAIVCACAFAVSAFSTTAAKAVAASNTQVTDQVATMVFDSMISDHSGLSHFEARKAMNFRYTSTNLRIKNTGLKAMKTLKVNDLKVK